MPVTQHKSSTPVGGHGTTASSTGSNHLNATTARLIAVIRIAFGFTFLWAFIDKVFALGFHTGYGQDGKLDRFGDAAWIHGGSPTEGFLKFGADGPFKGVFNSLGGTAIADWGFMLGLLGIGLALTLGIGMRVAAVAGGVMYLLMWAVVLPPENNPVIDEHILGGLTVLALGLLNAGNTWGLGNWWSRQSIVESNPILK